MVNINMVNITMPPEDGLLEVSTMENDCPYVNGTSRPPAVVASAPGAVAVVCAAAGLSVLVVMSRAISAFMGFHLSAPAHARLFSVVQALLSGLGAGAALLCFQFPMDNPNPIILTTAAFLSAWCVDAIVILLVAIHLCHLCTMHEWPLVGALPSYHLVLIVALVLSLAGGLAVPAGLRARRLATCWPGAAQHWSSVDSDFWMSWVIVAIRFASVTTGLMVIKKGAATSVTPVTTADAAAVSATPTTVGTPSWALRSFLTEAMSHVILTMALGVPATVIGLAGPLLTSNETLLQLMTVRHVLLSVFNASVAVASFINESVFCSRHNRCTVLCYGGQCCLFPYPEVPPTRDDSVPDLTRQHVTLVAEYVTADDTYISECRAVGSSASMETESIFSLSASAQPLSLKDNFRRKTMFDRPSMVSRAANPTPQHGRHSTTSLNIQSNVSVSQTMSSKGRHPRQRDSIYSQVSSYDLANIPCYSDSPNQDGSTAHTTRRSLFQPEKPRVS